MSNEYCAIIGSRPEFLPWGLDEEDERCEDLKRQLHSRILNAIGNGVNRFAVALDAAAGLYAAEIINKLREVDDSICLICVIPWEEQSTKWTPELRTRYFAAQEKCSDVEFASHAYTNDCEISAMLIAVDMANTVIVAYGEDMLIPVAVRYMTALNKKPVFIVQEDYL